MKQTLQLRLGQHLTMTPQLQQAIRLLQLSALDLNQEIQEALDTNPMLEAEEEFEQTAAERKENPSSESAQQTPADGNDINNEREVKTNSPEMPEDLPVDTEWSDVYDSYSPPAPAGGEGSDTDFLCQRSKSDSLQDHLLWQLNLTRLCPSDQAIALTIIDSISPDGYLQASIEEIHSTVDLEEVALEDVEAVLHRVQAFDPPGIAARGPQECLLIQLDQLPPETAYLEQAIQLCSTHFKLLAAQDQAQIKRKMKIDDHELSAINQLIRSLHPRPGTLIADTEPEYVIPEVFVTKRNNSWHVELNPETMPRLRVNAEYAKLIRRADQSDDNTFLKNHLQEARWFLKSLLSRNETILRVASKIVEYQQAFFEHGEEAMKPLVLRDIAEALEMHESTISRVTTQKYMHTPRGTLEFKYFFSSHVSTSVGGECSATAIRAIIKKLVAAETPNKPLSDNKIATILSEQGINVARRTVAKYRESMGIPPSNERKRLV
ncbi:RNA polymerase factor sigma-54 [endosymbiont of Ridgeia piscesae]|jgi:RNA polymerase sigma-54 factor|uniref:RNA polymerase sigma-54 factor n=1 Tax=endosymbiont of Ridgeia piscesae TaxID=54398 RepID=A0A0T5YTC1_9GAMM|nr:RNA polymerase factor sigma-54 [endosymbiont of Ridgeia piscesae]KRT53729.1 RNA polymerase, sigma 54 subunit, RpoN/SigL [endosymbiont of Ridgeia piscesae]KRT58108.1 RNA polymerase, sigma 54 subunit, RpoN/SigL [endosymbiont of Ridgeia piscesae]